MAQDPSLRTALRELRRRRRQLDQAIDALEAVIGTEATGTEVNGSGDEPVARVRMPKRQRKPRGQGPGGAAGVAQVLKARPNEGLTADQLAEAMIANGWEPTTDDPARAARAAANRLRRDNPGEYELANARFFYRPQQGRIRQEAFTTAEGPGFQPQ